MDSDKLIALIEKYKSAKEASVEPGFEYGGRTYQRLQRDLEDAEAALCAAFKGIKWLDKDPVVLYEGKGYCLVCSGHDYEIRTFNMVVDLNSAPKEELDPFECFNRGSNECTIRMDHPQLGGADPCTGCPHLSYRR